MPWISTRSSMLATFQSDSHVVNSGASAVPFFLSQASVLASVSGRVPRTMSMGCSAACGFANASIFDSTPGSYVYWTPFGSPVLSITFSPPGFLTGLSFTVDSNDNYRIEVSTDGLSWMWLTTVPASAGRLTGLDDFTSNIASPNYLPDLNFPPTYVAFMRITATGDSFFSIQGLSPEFNFTETLPPRPRTAAAADWDVFIPNEGRFQVAIASSGAELLLSSDFGLTWAVIGTSRTEFPSILTDFDAPGGDISSVSLASVRSTVWHSRDCDSSPLCFWFNKSATLAT
jgi:hypothetical protein